MLLTCKSSCWPCCLLPLGGAGKSLGLKEFPGILFHFNFPRWAAALRNIMNRKNSSRNGETFQIQKRIPLGKAHQRLGLLSFPRAKRGCVSKTCLPLSFIRNRVYILFRLHYITFILHLHYNYYILLFTTASSTGSF